METHQKLACDPADPNPQFESHQSNCFLSFEKKQVFKPFNRPKKENYLVVVTIFTYFAFLQSLEKMYRTGITLE